MGVNDSVRAAQALHTVAEALWPPATAGSGDGTASDTSAVVVAAQRAVVARWQAACDGADNNLQRTLLALLAQVVPRDVPETTWVLVRTLTALLAPHWPAVTVRTGMMIRAGQGRRRIASPRDLSHAPGAD